MNSKLSWANFFVMGFLLGVLLVLLASCGYQRTLREHCHLGDTQTCDNLFGVNQEDIDADQEARLKLNEKEIQSLSTMVSSLIKDLNQVEFALNQSNTMINLLHPMALQQGADITAINQMLVDLNQDVVDLEKKIAYEQTRITSIQSDIAALQLQDGVVETIYPCGDRANVFDEAILKMKSGKLIAYFEGKGQERFLTILTPGSYRTTDQKLYCYFSVNSAGQLVPGSRY